MIGDAMVEKKKRHVRRKKGHYHTGVHNSPKAGECAYRSGWEKLYCVYLDGNVDVVKYSYEGVVIGYISNVATARIRKYFPDFLVEYASGEKRLVEIKPSNKLTNKRVQKKLEAARQWCSEHGATLEVITEHELKALGLL